MSSALFCTIWPPWQLFIRLFICLSEKLCGTALFRDYLVFEKPHYILEQADPQNKCWSHKMAFLFYCLECTNKWQNITIKTKLYYIVNNLIVRQIPVHVTRPRVILLQ